MAEGGKKLSQISYACTAPKPTDRIVLVSNVGPQAQTAYLTIQNLFTNSEVCWTDGDFLYIRISDTVTKKVPLQAL